MQQSQGQRDQKLEVFRAPHPVTGPLPVRLSSRRQQLVKSTSKLVTETKRLQVSLSVFLNVYSSLKHRQTSASLAHGGQQAEVADWLVHSQAIITLSSESDTLFIIIYFCIFSFFFQNDFVIYLKFLGFRIFKPGCRLYFVARGRSQTCMTVWDLFCSKLVFFLYYISEHVVCLRACIYCFHLKLCWDENIACGRQRPPAVWPIATLLCLHGDDSSSASLLPVWGRSFLTAQSHFLFFQMLPEFLLVSSAVWSLWPVVSSEMLADVPPGR